MIKEKINEERRKRKVKNRKILKKTKTTKLKNTINPTTKQVMSIMSSSMISMKTINKKRKKPKNLANLAEESARTRVSIYLFFHRHVEPTRFSSAELCNDLYKFYVPTWRNAVYEFFLFKWWKIYH